MNVLTITWPALAVILFLIQHPGAEVHYVSVTGQSAWEQSTAINMPCSLPAANSNVNAGDTIYLLEGTYSGMYINPEQSGTAESPIVYSNYPGDSVIITDASYGVMIDGQSYITVTGINFYYMGHFLYIRNNANHNTVSYCSFDKARDINTWGGSKIYYTSQYNHVHHCSFSRWGFADGTGSTAHRGALFDVGREAETTDSSYYNLIENNTFAYGGHHVLAAWSQFSIFRNNYLHHEDVTIEGVNYGYRCAISHGAAVDRNLFEGNRIAFADYSSGFSLRSSNNIFRFNEFYNNGLGGIQVVSMTGYTPAHYNHIFHNVFYHNGHEAEYSGFSGGVYFADWGEGDPTGNVLKNNIFFENAGGMITTDAVTDPQILEGNWDTGDPLFTDIATPYGPVTDNYPDFHLQAASDAIDNGVFITTITSPSGSGTQFTVEDAGYFTNGWGMIPGDLIQLEGQTQRARITHVDYDNHAIAVDNSLTWTQNIGLSLAYEGSTPDQGAHEYGASAGLKDLGPTQSLPRIKVYQHVRGQVTIHVAMPRAQLVKSRLNIYSPGGVLIDELSSRDGIFIWNNNFVSNGIYLLMLDGTDHHPAARLIITR